MKLETTSEIELARRYVENTSRNIFLTGKAGTGKTTFLEELRKVIHKSNIVVAPTGVAAINANGVTIHSFFQLELSPFIPGLSNNKGPRFRFTKRKIDIIKNLELLIIDEISMVRADILDAIDSVLKRYRPRHRFQPFAGVQLLMIGDLQQLPPVCKDEEWELLKDYYDNEFFFSSLALKSSDFITISLSKVFRQKDQGFIDILNKIRNDNMDIEAINTLNSRFIYNFKPKDEEGYITLCTHNRQAKGYNDNRLDKIDSKEYRFEAEIEGKFPENSYPNDFELVFKKGAQVMFIKNDFASSWSERRYYNGKIGRITEINEDEIYVRCVGESEDILVDKYAWENVKYTVNNTTKEIEKEVSGRFVQYPIKLAWAVTIHKSQGQTFDKVIIDSNQSFSPGQVYVALSRSRTLEGIVLKQRFDPNSLIFSPTINEFENEQEKNKPNETTLKKDSFEYRVSMIKDFISFAELKYTISSLKDLNETDIYTLNPEAYNNLNELIKAYDKEIHFISITFSNTIDKMQELSNQSTIDNRLFSSTSYYLEKISIVKDIIAELNNIKEGKKEFRDKKSDIITKLEREYTLQNYLLKEFSEYFDPIEYSKTNRTLRLLDDKIFFKTIKRLSNKADKPIEKQEKPFQSLETISLESKLSIDSIPIFDKLREWRKHKSQVQNIPLFQVLSQDLLIEISNIKPRNIQELNDIANLSQTQIHHYGEEILDIINNHIQ